MTKLASVSVVKNESDIIETWVRYHSRVVDVMLIVDNDSSDTTAEIIFQLIAEGLRVLYLFDPDPIYAQDSMTTGLLYAALNDQSPDFVIPLDADEFIISDGRIGDIRDELLKSLTEDCFYQMRWLGYVPTKNDPTNELQVLRRITYRRSVELEPVFKVILPAAIARSTRLKLKQGNHDVNLNGSDPYFRKELTSVGLAHFPIRSLEQLKTKCLIGWLANSAKPGHVIFDWLKYYLKFKNGHVPSIDELTELALRRGLSLLTPSPSIVRAPIDADFPLKYSLPEERHSEYALLRHCEGMARLLVDNVAHANFADRSERDCEKYYGQQLLNQHLVRFFGNQLHPSEAFLLWDIVESKASDTFVACSLGDMADEVNEFLRSLVDQKSRGVFNELKTSSLQTLNATFTNIHEDIDLLFFGNNLSLSLLYSTFEQWSKLLRYDGWIAFMGIQNDPSKLEFVEKEISPNSNWVNKRLEGGLFISQKNSKLKHEA